MDRLCLVMQTQPVPRINDINRRVSMCDICYTAAIGSSLVVPKKPHSTVAAFSKTHNVGVQKVGLKRTPPRINSSYLRHFCTGDGGVDCRPSKETSTAVDIARGGVIFMRLVSTLIARSLVASEALKCT